jgi:hypothetical protein
MQIKDWLVCSLIGGVAALTADAAVPNIVEARTVGSATGLTVPSATPCISPWHGMFQNVCESTISVDLPLVLDTDSSSPPLNWKQVYVGTFAQTDQGIGCRGQSISKSFDVTYDGNGGAYTWAPAGQSQINMYAINVLAGGSVVVNCQVGMHGWLETIGYENRSHTGWP